MSCGLIALDRKTGDDAGRNTQVYDNIATGFAIGNGSTASRRDHNMVRSGAGTGDFAGTPALPRRRDPHHLRRLSPDDRKRGRRSRVGRAERRRPYRVAAVAGAQFREGAGR